MGGFLTAARIFFFIVCVRLPARGWETEGVNEKLPGYSDPSGANLAMSALFRPEEADGRGVLRHPWLANCSLPASQGEGAPGWARGDQWSGAYPDATVSAVAGICHTVKWVYGRRSGCADGVIAGGLLSIPHRLRCNPGRANHLTDGHGSFTSIVEVFDPQKNVLPCPTMRR